jgi:hypothetical protein
VPVWHEATQEWVRDGRLVVLGVIQEQHADRCRLFAQWKQFDWPILHDPVNVLQPAAVPILVAVDEHGIVRSTRPRLDTLETEFLDKNFIDAGPRIIPEVIPPLDKLQRRVAKSDDPELWRGLGDRLAIWHYPQHVDAAIAAYAKAVELAPDDADALFRLGVAYRLRFDSSGRRPDDFQQAVENWERALAKNPNQYIWRRRIQQYGPRLDKPYPFYDWVEQAREEIRARGETPVELAVPPGGAEIAAPSRQFTVSPGPGTSPDPAGRIQRDTSKLIRVEATVVPTEAEAGQPLRAHLTFIPDDDQQAYWYNEAEPLRIWFDPPAGWQVSQRLLTAEPGRTAESREVRHLDVELRVPEGVSGAVRVPAYALYYVCEGKNGTCQFLRRELEIVVRVK